MTDVELLRVIICSLVDYPESVRIERTTDEMGVLISVSCDKSDMGRIIGREGTTAKAIRTIIRAFGMKNSSRINIKINEPA